jgi:hypothetical protein
VSPGLLLKAQCGIAIAALQHRPERVSYVRTEWN